MYDKETEDLRNPDNWDWESAEWHEPVKEPGTVIAVRFAGEDASRIFHYAKIKRQRVTDFIRDTVLERLDELRPTG